MEQLRSPFVPRGSGGHRKRGIFVGSREHHPLIWGDQLGEVNYGDHRDNSG